MTRIVFPLFPRVTQLDFAGPYEVLSRLPGAKVHLASQAGGSLRTEHGLTYEGLERLADIAACDVICVPGGHIEQAIADQSFIGEIARLAKTARYITSVCNGALLLGAAGLLHGKRCTTHWALTGELARFGAIATEGRVVKDGNLITGGGVTAGIDFALTLVAELADPMTAQLTQLLIEYAPAPPFQSGRPETAPPEVLAALKARAARGAL